MTVTHWQTLQSAVALASLVAASGEVEEGASGMIVSCDLSTLCCLLTLMGAAIESARAALAKLEKVAARLRQLNRHATIVVAAGDIACTRCAARRTLRPCLPLCAWRSC